MSMARSSVSQAALAHKWNQRFPVGTPVRYWTGLREGLGKVSKTRSAAEVLGGHTAVVWIENQVGCVALSHVEPLPAVSGVA
jgi:hypothetical protein